MVPPVVKKDTVRKKMVSMVKPVPVKPDTVQIPPDTAKKEAPPVIVRCQNDTLAPYVYPDPSGGLHYGELRVRFKTSKPCTVEWKFGGEKIWHVYSGDSIVIARNVILYFKARDTCGNSMDIRSERYEIATPLKKKYCAQDMEYITVGASSFCIDKYEWPNKFGRRPRSNVSIYQAADSCFTVEKRLCTTDEWSLACGGIYNWKYPYGDVYEPEACVTKDTAPFPSGSRVECRGYFNVYDMSGNLAEWTDTRSKTNSYFYNVMGGFWQSGPQSSCFEPRYSYYPQNKHNPVGFRCCKEVNKDFR
jgi:hypothetical protein